MDKRQAVHLKRGQAGTQLQNGCFLTTDWKKEEVGEKKKKKDKHTYTIYILQTVLIAYGNVTSEITEVHLKIQWLWEEMGCLLVED